MPRSNRPRRSKGRGPRRPEQQRPLRPSTVEVTYQGQVWSVRTVRANDSGKVYVCPGCQHEVTAATPHTVVWPADAMQGVENRRHWHTPCWGARERRRPPGSWA